MKIRSDFVTNSSSSSFISVFAKIKDKEKAGEIIKKQGLEKCIFSNAKLQKMKENDFGKCLSNNGLDLAQVKEDSEWYDLFLLWEDYEDIGYWEDDYSKFDISDFSMTSQTIFNSISEENGFEVISSGFWAGYNG